MATGDDNDRWLWPERVTERLTGAATAGAVPACSALELRCRDFIRWRIGKPVRFTPG